METLSFLLLALRGFVHMKKNCPRQKIHKVLIKGVRVLFTYVPYSVYDPKPVTASVTGVSLQQCGEQKYALGFSHMVACVQQVKWDHRAKQMNPWVKLGCSYCECWITLKSHFEREHEEAAKAVIRVEVDDLLFEWTHLNMMNFSITFLPLCWLKCACVM